ncbi:DUF881 domain-containing protein [Motilibacter sp. E257]|uniref:DUF881 domain-containing protein n=1 Tax=Motilibacter deserti TaxID=2714956 RepID=A0ABX0GZ79_9ACTN|nr:DUF881 domain-containing protein [Motilibacter deserti]
MSGLPWKVLAPVAAACAGLLFAASAGAARGADLRAGERTDLTDLIRAAERRVAAQTQDVGELRARVDQLAEAAGDPRLAAAQREADALAARAGLEAAAGPGVTVTLDDSTYDADDPALPDGTTPDDLVVHEQDVQGVVNALWAGGAEAVQVMDQRLVATSAVRCAGNVLFLHGRTYAPPFTITAIGDVDRLRGALDDEPAIQVLQEYVDQVGLRYDVRDRRRVEVPAFTGPLQLPHASVPSSSPSAASGGTP